LNEPLKQLFGGHTWLLILVAALPLAGAFVFEAMPAWAGRLRERKLKDRGVQGTLNRPGYFRITPYEDAPVDRKAYARPDGAHKDVVAWLRHAQQPVLYLTGLSGTGKSSMLAAYALPQLREGSVPVRAIVVPRHDSLRALREELLRPGVIWKKPPVEAEDLKALVAKAAEYLHSERLLLVFDQFEEFLILNDRDPERLKAIGELLA